MNAQFDETVFDDALKSEIAKFFKYSPDIVKLINDKNYEGLTDELEILIWHIGYDRRCTPQQVLSAVEDKPCHKNNEIIPADINRALVAAYYQRRAEAYGILEIADVPKVLNKPEEVFTDEIKVRIAAFFDYDKNIVELLYENNAYVLHKLEAEFRVGTEDHICTPQQVLCALANVPSVSLTIGALTAEENKAAVIENYRLRDEVFQFLDKTSKMATQNLVNAVMGDELFDELSRPLPRPLLEISARKRRFH